MDDNTLKHIPGDELWADRKAALEDAQTCLVAIYGGITTYGTDNQYDVESRLATNVLTMKLITAELKRRHEERYPPSPPPPAATE